MLIEASLTPFLTPVIPSQFSKQWLPNSNATQPQAKNAISDMPHHICWNQNQASVFIPMNKHWNFSGEELDFSRADIQHPLQNINSIMCKGWDKWLCLTSVLLRLFSIWLSVAFLLGNTETSGTRSFNPLFHIATEKIKSQSTTIFIVD